jgi:hypothetical protein
MGIGAGGAIRSGLGGAKAKASGAANARTSWFRTLLSEEREGRRALSAASSPVEG